MTDAAEVRAAAALGELAELQRAFGDALRLPLDRATGTLRATPERYGAALCAQLAGGDAARARLAVYQRQYWFRLFSALHNEYRLVTALLGPWTFNALASEFLRAEPPRGHDLAEIGARLAPFVAAAVPEAGVAIDGTSRWVPRAALLDALEIDRAFQRVFAMGPRPPLQLSDGDAAVLSSARLVASPGVALVDEGWPFVRLRARMRRDLEQRLALPPPHPAPRSWAVVGKARGVRVLPLVPLHARLLRALAAQPVAAALAEVEAACAPGEAALLAAQARGWLAQSVELGMWAGLARGAA